MLQSKPPANAPSAFLGLGSNLGDRIGLLAEAVARLARDPGVRVDALSSPYATAPVGLPGEPEFINAVVGIRTVYGPGELLELCLAIEAGLGRVRQGGLSSRTLDIDVLLYGDIRLEGGRLTLPHPRMLERAFVLFPLAEIAPGLVLGGRTVASWAASSDAAGVRRLDAPAGWPAARPCEGLSGPAPDG